MPTELQIMLIKTCHYLIKRLSSFFLGDGEEADGKGECYIEKMFTYVLWRNGSNGTVEYSIVKNYGGKSNKTEHQDKNYKVQQDQKAQEGEVGLDASTKFPWE